MGVKVAFQGEHGAYSEAATIAFFGAEVETVPCESFDLVFDSVEKKDCAYGLVPIENSLAGTIHRNYDLMLQHQLSIVGEYYLRVHHCLIALPGVQISDIRQVISHPQGLAQCEGYLKSLGNLKTEPVYDTAGSVKMVKEKGDRTLAAIASRRAAELYGMQILAEGIEDNPNNYTRFLAIARDPVVPAGDSKTSIVFTLENKAGSLFKALSLFALNDIDLTKIESRPLVGTLWEYFFYVDLKGSINDLVMHRAINHLGEYAPMLRVLGSYPRHQMK